VSEPVEQLLQRPHAHLTRSHLAELGLGRAAIDQVFRLLPVYAIPGTRQPRISVADYLAFVEEHTYADDRVRP
jgi:hypothetical protein